MSFFFERFQTLFFLFPHFIDINIPHSNKITNTNTTYLNCSRMRRRRNAKRVKNLKQHILLVNFTFFFLIQFKTIKCRLDRQQFSLHSFHHSHQFLRRIQNLNRLSKWVILEGKRSLQLSNKLNDLFFGTLKRICNIIHGLIGCNWIRSFGGHFRVKRKIFWFFLFVQSNRILFQKEKKKKIKKDKIKINKINK